MTRTTTSHTLKVQQRQLKSLYIDYQVFSIKHAELAKLLSIFFKKKLKKNKDYHQSRRQARSV